jgi:hypothetical protein
MFCNLYISSDATIGYESIYPQQRIAFHNAIDLTIAILDRLISVTFAGSKTCFFADFILL